MAEVVVLGSAQDGGLPHAGCLCRNCVTARNGGRRSLPVSLGIVSGLELAMIDATSAFEAQMHTLWSRSPASQTYSLERFQPPETIILTHAHTGHYIGLWQLDRSVLAANNVQVIGPQKTLELLRTNEPWAQMVGDGFIRFNAVPFDAAFEPIAGVKVTLIEVPHRSEWATDTVALRIEGSAGSLLYIPDIDSWDEWDRDLAQMVRDVDVALVDGCFWQAPNRTGVPHPPILDTMARLQDVVDAQQARIIFTHLNHSNPVFDSTSDERLIVAERGFEIAMEGDVFTV